MNREKIGGECSLNKSKIGGKNSQNESKIGRKCFLNKRGQVAQTLTWIVAFSVVFFAMLLFIGAALVLSSGKKATVLSYEISSEYNSGSLELQRNLIGFLNSEIGYSGKILAVNQIVADSAAVNVLENSARVFFDDVYSDCYVICLNTGGKESIFIGSGCSGGEYTCEISEEDIVEGQTKMDVYSGTEKTEVEIIRGNINPK